MSDQEKFVIDLMNVGGWLIAGLIGYLFGRMNAALELKLHRDLNKSLADKLRICSEELGKRAEKTRHLEDEP